MQQYVFRFFCVVSLEGHLSHSDGLAVRHVFVLDLEVQVFLRVKRLRESRHTHTRNNKKHTTTWTQNARSKNTKQPGKTRK